MSKNRNKFYIFAAGYLVSKNIKFTYSGTYLASATFDLSNDLSDKTKVWIEKEGQWYPFVDLEKFKIWIRQNI